MGKTFNPFKVIGSYVGLLVGYFAILKGINAFGFLVFFMFLDPENMLTANLVGGFMAGYVLHIFLRAVVNIGMFKAKKSTGMKEIGRK